MQLPALMNSSSPAFSAGATQPVTLESCTAVYNGVMLSTMEFTPWAVAANGYSMCTSWPEAMVWGDSSWRRMHTAV